MHKIPLCSPSSCTHTLCLKPHYIPKSTGGFQLSFSQSFLPPAAWCWLVSGSSLPRGYGTDLETEYWALSSFMISCGVFETASRGLCKALELCKASDFREGFGLSWREKSVWVKGWDVGRVLILVLQIHSPQRLSFPISVPSHQIGL